MRLVRVIIVVIASVIAQFGFDGLLLATLVAGFILVIGGLVRAGRFISLHAGARDRGIHGGHRADHCSQSAQGSARPFRAHVRPIIHGLPALWAAQPTKCTALAVGTFAIAGIALLRHRIPGSRLLACRCRRVCARPLPLQVDTIYSRFGMLPAGSTTTHPALEHCTDRRAIALRVPDRLPCGGGVASICHCRRPDDREQPPLECRAPRSRRREHHLAFVRRAAGQDAIANRYKRSRGRTNSSRRNRARGDDSRHFVRCRSLPAISPCRRLLACLS